MMPKANVTDIVDRLRYSDIYDYADADALCDEAADEIERLRAALREAYEVYAGSDGFIPETASEGYQQQVIKQMVDCISTALEGK